MNTIKVLGICASPRKGNSEYILGEALKVLDSLPFETETDILTLRGREIKPCVGCFFCFFRQNSSKSCGSLCHSSFFLSCKQYHTDTAKGGI